MGCPDHLFFICPSGRPLAVHGKIRWPTTVFKRQHAAAMTHRRVEIRLGHVVVSPLGVEEDKLGRLHPSWNSLSRVPVGLLEAGQHLVANALGDLAADLDTP